MSQYIINVGSTPNDGTGDTLRVSQQKANANFTELYNTKGDMFKSVYDTDNDGVVDSSKKEIVQFINKSGATLTKGTIVYLKTTSSSAMYPEVLKANAATEATSSKTIGAVFEDVLNDGIGFIVTSGEVRNINTSAYVIGDKLWLSTTDGLVTTTPPTPPNHTVFIGTVTRSQTVNGRILYAIQNGYELNELHNVLISSPTNDQILTYESATSLWKNKNASGGSLDQYYIVHFGIAKSTSYVGANGWQTADRNTATLFNDTSPFGAYYNGTIITDARIAKIKLPFDCQIVDGSFQFTHAGTYGTENFRVLGFDISGSSVVGTTTIASASYTQGSSGANGNLSGFYGTTLLKGTFITYAVQSVVANTYIAQGIVTLVFKKI